MNVIRRYFSHFCNINKKQAIIGLKIIVIFILLGIGGGFVSTGWLKFVEDPVIEIEQKRKATIPFSIGQQGDFEIILHSDNGIVPYNKIKTNIKIIFPEFKNNTSNVEIRYPKAMIQLSEQDENPKVEKPTGLSFASNDTKRFSTYVGDPILIYPYEGKFDVILIITNDNTKSVEKSLGTIENTRQFTYEALIDVKSLDYYHSLKRENNSLGMALMVVGLSFIMVISVPIKLIDLYVRLSKTKKKWGWRHIDNDIDELF